MIRSILLLVLCAVSVSAFVELTDSNFDSTVVGEKSWFLLFEASFCGEPCEKLRVELETFAESAQDKVSVGTVAHDQLLVKRFSVVAYPTLLFVRQNQYYVFDGTRKSGEFTKFASGGYEQNTPSAVPPAVAITSDVVELDKDSFNQKVFAKRGAYWAVMFYTDDDVEWPLVSQHYEGLGTFMRGKINIGKVHSRNQDLHKRYVGEDKVPALYVFRGGKKYHMEQALQSENMQGFVESGYSKVPGVDLVVPEGVGDGGDVLTLTDSNFELLTEASSKNGKPWFVKFYAPWCGHCKAIAPMWEELGTELKHKMKVGKVDCPENKNTTDRFAIPGFPTLLFFKGGRFWKYDGDLRTKEAFVKWVTEDYKEKEGYYVPPPPGTPVPEQTLLDQAALVLPALQAMYEYNPMACVAVWGAGASVGAFGVLYIALMKAILRMAPSTDAKKTPKKRKNA